jgi:hypothetical protein
VLGTDDDPLVELVALVAGRRSPALMQPRHYMPSKSSEIPAKSGYNFLILVGCPVLIDESGASFGVS